MPFPLIPLIATIGSGIAGALSNRESARTSTSTPIEPAEFKTLGDLLRKRAESRLMSTPDLTGLEAGGVQRINETFAPIQQSINADLTSRGLGTSPVAGAVNADVNLARGGQIAQFLNTLPLVRRQMEDQDFASASGLFAARPMGTTGVGAGSVLGSGIGSAAEMLAFLRGQGMFRQDVPGF